MLKAIAAGFLGVAAIAYPIAVYFGLTRFGLARLAWALMAYALVLGGLRWLSRRRQSLAPLLLPSIVIAVLALAGWRMHQERILLATPSLINFALLISFGQSLWFAPPMVERFARLTEPSLDDAEIKYCRQVTMVWCGFFAFNAAVAGSLAWAAPLSWWATYTGLISYVMVGLLMSVEYIVRKRRFQKFGKGPHDRFLALLLSTKTSQP